MLGQLWTMTVGDLRQRVRDRSVLVFGLVVPLALMYVFNLVFGDVDQVELQPVTVAVAVPSGDPIAAAVPATLRAADLGQLRVTVKEGTVAEVRRRVERGDAHLGILVPAGLQRALRDGRPVTVQALEGDGREIEDQVLLSVVDGVLRRLTSGSVAARAALAGGVPPAELASIARAAAEQAPVLGVRPGRAADEQLDASGALVAGQAGLFLLFTVGFGVLGLVLERESGTLARLRSMPMRPGLVVVAKALVGYVLGVVATSVLLTAGGLLFGVDFGSVPVVAALVLCVVAAATSLMFVVVRLARTSEQAGVAQSILALVLGIAGGAFFPVNAPGAIDRVLDLNPIAAFTRGLGVTAGGGGWGDVAGPVGVMLAFAAVVLLASRLLPDRGVAA